MFPDFTLGCDSKQVSVLLGNIRTEQSRNVHFILVLKPIYVEDSFNTDSYIE
jgi:hypothetical protein